MKGWNLSISQDQCPSKAEVGKLWPLCQIWLTTCFCAFYKWRMVSTRFKWLKNLKRKIFCDKWKLYEIQIAVSVNKVLLEHSHTHSFVYHLSVFTLQLQSWVAAMEIWWFTKSNYLPPSPLQKKFANSCFRVMTCAMHTRLISSPPHDICHVFLWIRRLTINNSQSQNLSEGQQPVVRERQKLSRLSISAIHEEQGGTRGWQCFLKLQLSSVPDWTEKALHPS